MTSSIESAPFDAEALVDAQSPAVGLQIASESRANVAANLRRLHAQWLTIAEFDFDSTASRPSSESR